MSSEHDQTAWNEKSVQEVSKQKPRSDNLARHPKTDARYWQRAVFLPTYSRNGQIRQTGEYAAKIQHAGRRETFPLGSSNRTAAAARAKEIYLSIEAAGWDATVAKFKSKARIEGAPVITVGQFLEEVSVNAGGRPKTVEDYCRAFRTIVADISNVDSGREKYDYRHGGRQTWLAKVHGVKLSEITPERVQKWRVKFLRRAGSDPIRQRAARISCNSLMRQAKSLFTPERLKFIRLDLSGALPFDGIKFEQRQSMRYRSRFDVEQVIKAAQVDLPSEQMKIFLLAIMAGLRRNEIDKLEWSAFRWSEGVIRIEATHHFQPKSEDSIGDVDVDPELLEIFRGFQARAKGTFVIESSNAPRVAARYAHYRCQKEFEKLNAWLRAVGVVANTPLHTLRKEYGSQICAKHGIYAASHALRHSDIAITSQHYLDRKRRATVGMGHLLERADAVIPICATIVASDCPERLGKARA